MSPTNARSIRAPVGAGESGVGEPIHASWASEYTRTECASPTEYVATSRFSVALTAATSTSYAVGVADDGVAPA